MRVAGIEVVDRREELPALETGDRKVEADGHRGEGAAAAALSVVGANASRDRPNGLLTRQREADESMTAAREARWEPVLRVGGGWSAV